MTDYSYSKVAVYAELGGALRLARNSRTFVTDTVTGLPVNVTQNGFTAPYFDTDSHGIADFSATTPGPIRLTTGAVFVDVYSEELPATLAGKLDSTVASSTYVPQAATQATELLPEYVFTVTPKTAGYAPFQVVENSFNNTGAGAGTYNHGVWFGFNAARHADSAGAFTAGKPACYMGFEDNYYDNGGDNAYGVEWYVGYITPDGTTVPVANLRPFYFRVTDSTTNTAGKNALINMDIGSGAGGSLNVWGSVQTGHQLLAVTQTQVLSYLPVNTIGNLQVGNVANTAAQITIKAPGGTGSGPNASLNFNVGATPGFSLLGVQGPTRLIFTDNTNARTHVRLTGGATDALALTELLSKVSISSDLAVTGKVSVGTWGPVLNNRQISDGASTAVMDFGTHNWPTSMPLMGATGVGFETGGGIKITDSTIYTGSGVPSFAPNANGDIYFNATGGAGTTIYQRRAGAWVATAA